MISINEKGFFHYKCGLFCRYNKENAIFSKNTPSSHLCPFRMSTSYYWEIKSALTSGQSRQRKHSFSFYDTQYKLIKQQEGWYIPYICMNDTKQIRHTRKADHGNQFCTYYVFLTLLSNGTRNSQIQNKLIKSSICCHSRKLKPLVHWWEEILQTLLHCTGRLHQSLKQVNGGKNKNQTTQASALNQWLDLEQIIQTLEMKMHS